MTTTRTHPFYRLAHHLHLSGRPINHNHNARNFLQLRTYASSRSSISDKSRILEKPTRFNPPSHGSRRVRPRQFPGPPLSEQERQVQKTKRYPNMMPPEGSFMYSFLTDRRVHLWITLGTLAFLASYSFSQSFLHTTIYRQDLPYWSDLLSHPFQTIGQFYTVYKLHVAYESEKVAEKRRQKLADASKRKEFLRDHGVEPGFLTGSWMDKFGTVEGDKWKADREAASRRVTSGDGADAQEDVQPDIQNPLAMAAGSIGAASPSDEHGEQGDEITQHRQEKKKVKMWLGIW